MKKLNDAEIQNLLEQGLPVAADQSENEDARAYQFLFKQLKQEPLTGLSYNFSAKVARRARAAHSRRQGVKLYLFVSTIIFFAVALTVAFVIALNNEETWQLFNVVRQYKWLFVYVLAGILVIQYFDQKVIRNKWREIN